MTTRQQHQQRMTPLMSADQSHKRHLLLTGLLMTSGKSRKSLLLANFHATQLIAAHDAHSDIPVDKLTFSVVQQHYGVRGSLRAHLVKKTKICLLKLYQFVNYSLVY